MYLHLIILCPVLLFLGLSLVFVARENLKCSNTSIELNIVDKNDVVLKKEDKNKRTKMHHIPKFMLEIYEKNKWIDRSTVRPDVVRSLIPKHAGTLYNNEIIEKLTDKHLLIFDLPTSPIDEKFIGAELKIMTLVGINSKEESGVKRIIRVSTFDYMMNQLSNSQEMEIQHYNNSWLSFNLTSSVSDVLKRENRHLKIVLTVSAYFSNFKNTLKISLMPLFIDNFEHDYPVLLLSYASSYQGRNVRKKRSVEAEDYEEDTNKIWDDYSKKVSKKLKRMKNSCRRRPLYIDFEEIDYDLWIVQPKGYEAYQCQGKCYYPVAEHLNPTKHAIFQALLHSVAPNKVTRSCCVPTVLDSISILYVDEKGVLTYRYAYKDMVVSECGCR